jgi:hypothetical protein
MNHMHIGNLGKWVPKVTLFLVVGQRISSTMATLMQDEMNKASSHMELLDQFHIK